MTRDLAPEPSPIHASPFDPKDWEAFRDLGRRMIDDLVDQLQALGEGPVWRPPTDEVRAAFATEAVGAPVTPDAVYAEYLKTVAPYASGNRHPGFMGWVQGGGAPVGALAEMLAAGLNMNCGGRDHVGLELERQIALWARSWFGLPDTSAGLFVTGASQANFMSVLAARSFALGSDVRKTGLSGARLAAYAQVGAHACVVRAIEMAGIGREALRLIPTDADFRISTEALRRQIAADKAAGITPFLIVGTAGTVDVGAFDDLAELADIAEASGAWLHVDGAFGALGVHAPSVKGRLKGLARARSIAFDFHKWGQVPYDAGFLIVADEARLTDVFSSPAAYLSRASSGLAAGEVWPTDLGPDLSRGCRALKTWFVLRTCGTEAIGEAIEHGLHLAQSLARRIDAHDRLERLAPADLNIVCFRYVCERSDQFNAEIVQRLQLAGRVAPSLTRIGGKVSIRAALFNPRTTEAELDALIAGVLALGGELEKETDNERQRSKS